MTKRSPPIIGFRKNSGGNSNMVKKAYAPVWKFKWTRSVLRRQYCSRIPLTLTHLYLWRHAVNSNFKIYPIGACMQIWIPAKAPATNAVRLESRILMAFYHGRIGAWIPLQVPEKPQCPHAHTHTDKAKIKYMMMMMIVDVTKPNLSLDNELPETTPLYCVDTIIDCPIPHLPVFLILTSST